MPFQITQARSRVTKARPKNPLAKRPGAAGASPRKRSPAMSASAKRAAAEHALNGPGLARQGFHDDDEGELDDFGLISHLESDPSLRDVAQYARWIEEHMFEDIPPRAGMTSTRIAEVLNYRRGLPPMVTRAHIHALCPSPTATEREIVDLIRAGVLRKMEISGRGMGASGIGECLVLTKKWVELVQSTTSLSDGLKAKYTELLHASRGATTVDAQCFTQDEATALVQAGFLTAATAAHAGTVLQPDSSTLGSLLSLASAGSRATSGSVSAVGGTSAIQDVGGGGAGRSLSQGASGRVAAAMSFAVPSVGTYLKLLAAAREHLTRLLSQKPHRQTTVDLLREQWDGGLDPTHPSRRTPGLQGVVLPGRTKKWKQLYGLRFQWVLEECLGTGLVEIFDTGSVGHGVRLAS